MHLTISRYLYLRLGLCLAVLWPSLLLAASYVGPVPAASDLYGKPGPYGVEQKQFPNLLRPSLDVTVYLPLGISGVRPTWFFAHGFGAIDPKVYHLLCEHLCSQGYVVVYPSYPVLETDDSRYDIIDAGFREAALRFPSRIDTQSVIFAGHSYGAGATPFLALRALRERKWGKTALGLWVMAPWYSLNVSNADLNELPAYTQAVYQLYQEDLSNDHRIGIDLFRNLPLPADQKACMFVSSDLIESYQYEASHSLCTSDHVAVDGRTAPYDALDSWAVFRLASAFSSSVFARDAQAAELLYARGTDHEISLGASSSGRAMRPVLCRTSPLPAYPQLRYNFPWSSPLNPRRAGLSREFVIPGTRLVNLSARAIAGRGMDTLVLGAVMGGSSHKNLLVRAVGESLRGFGLTQVLDDPKLRLFSGSIEQLQQDDWGSQYIPGLQSSMSETWAFPLATNSHDSAVSLLFGSGALTAHVALKDGATPAVTLVEAYDADLSSENQLLNLSVRAQVGTGEQVLIVGWVVEGPGKVRLLLRAVGDTLKSYGVSGTLADPQVEVFHDSKVIFTNDDWGTTAAETLALQNAFTTSQAFPLPVGSKDSALIMDLDAGNYTAIVTGVNRGTGVALLELYVLP